LRHNLRELLHGPRSIVGTDAPWHWMPDELRPWDPSYQQAQGHVLILWHDCLQQLPEAGPALLRSKSGKRFSASLPPTAACWTGASGPRQGPPGQRPAGTSVARRLRGSVDEDVAFREGF
jgi:hypothetical protein